MAGSPWLTQHAVSVSVFTSCPPSLCLSLLLFEWYQSYQSKAILPQYDSLTHTLMTSTKTLFPGKVTVTGTQGSDFSLSFG